LKFLFLIFSKILFVIFYFDKFSFNSSFSHADLHFIEVLFWSEGWETSCSAHVTREADK